MFSPDSPRLMTSELSLTQYKAKFSKLLAARKLTCLKFTQNLEKFQRLKF